MEQGTGQQQAAIDGGTIETGEKIGLFQHIGRVHQQTAHKAMVDAFGRGNAAEILLPPLEHHGGNGAVIVILYGLHQLPHPAQHGVSIDGRRRCQGRQVHGLLGTAQPQGVDAQLERAHKLGDGAGDVDDAPGILLTDGAVVVFPQLGVHGAAGVLQYGAEEGFSVFVGLGVGGLQKVEALHFIVDTELIEGNMLFHWSCPPALLQ